MKNIVKISLLIVSLGMTVFMLSCNLEAISFVDSGTGVLELVLNKDNVRDQSWYPHIDMDIDYYKISGNGPFDRSFVIDNYAESTLLKKDLKAGNWTLLVEGYNQEGEKIAATENIEITVLSNQTKKVTARLAPLKGTGTFALNINWEEADQYLDNPRIRLTFKDKEGENILREEVFSNFQSSQKLDKTFTLDAKWYELEISLDDFGANEEYTTVWQDVFALRVLTDKYVSGSVTIKVKDLNFNFGRLEVSIQEELEKPFDIDIFGIPQNAEIGQSFLAHVIGDFDDTTIFRWYVNGIKQNDCNEDIFEYEFESAGAYTITVLVLKDGALAKETETVLVEYPDYEDYLDIFKGIIKDGNGNSLAGQNHDVTFTEDRLGNSNKALAFNGENSYIKLHTPEVDYSEFALSLYFKTGKKQGVLIGNNDGSSNPTYGDKRIYISDEGKLYAGVYSPGVNTVNTSVSVADNEWHHVILYQDSEGLKLILDNIEVGSLEKTTGHLDTFYWNIGYNPMIADWGDRPKNFYFDGEISDILIYSKDQLGQIEF